MIKIPIQLISLVLQCLKPLIDSGESEKLKHTGYHFDRFLPMMQDRW